MRIKLSAGYSIVPEGTHVFKITNVEQKDDFGKLTITMKTKEGATHTERFSFLSNGETNDGALAAFSYFARTALNDFDLDEIDPKDLLGHYIECDVEHEEVESTKTPGKYVKYSRLKEKRPANGYEGEEESPVPEEKPVSSDVDLEELLGRL